MTGLMMEEFMEEEPFKLKKGLDFTIGDGCGPGGRDPGAAKWLQQRVISKYKMRIEHSEWFHLARVLPVLYNEHAKVI